jgi:hypothetical protein
LAVFGHHTENRTRKLAAKFKHQTR